MVENNIKSVRQSKGLSTTQLAEILGVSQPTVTRWEQGRRNLTLENLGAIAAALGCAAWQLLPTAWQPRQKFIDDQERFFRILGSVNRALDDQNQTVPEEEKLRLVMYLYNEGYGRAATRAANDNDISRAVKIATRAA